MNQEAFDWGVAFLLFLTYIAFDFLYAIYYIFVGKKQAFLAASTGVAMYLLSSFATIVYLKNFYYITAIVLGAFIGTYTAVKYFSGKNEVQPNNPHP